MPRYVGICVKPGGFPYAKGSGILTRRFGCDEDAVAFAREVWGKKKLIMIVLRVNPDGTIVVVGKVRGKRWPKASR
jgi:hypothetical protein